MTPSLKALTPGPRRIALLFAVAAIAGLAMAGRAEASPQFAAVGQSLGTGGAETTLVTYYSRNRNYYWRRDGYRPYWNNNWRYRYARPYYNWRPYYRSYPRSGFSYRGPNVYFRFGW